MNVIEIIEKKRDSKVLSFTEIEYVVNHFVDGSIPDYQMSAFLMAILMAGMNDEEVADLTKVLLYSGDVIDLSKVANPAVDKHSTGGVGDKTTLVLAPLLAAAGVKVAKLSGRGLGQTGGTLDKLEAISNFQVEISEADFMEQVKSIGIAVIGQTQNLVPADKKIYELRDVTGTVASIPLIASSIMSKKLASGADAIVLDVKCGSGAFMTDLDQAESLAREMVKIGKSFNKDVTAVISNMEQPLGFAIGNALEVYEAIATLKGDGPADVVQLCQVLGGRLLYFAKVVDSVELGELKIKEIIEDGSGYKKFLQFVAAQHGDVESLATMPIAKNKFEIIADADGYIAELQAHKFGVAGMQLGAGRETKDSIIDLSVGIILDLKVGDKVSRGERIATLY